MRPSLSLQTSGKRAEGVRARIVEREPKIPIVVGAAIPIFVPRSWSLPDNVFEAIEKGSNTIVVLESTVYPGVTAQTWLPIVEELGLVIGEDVSIAYCPERFNPGDPAHGVRSVARVIGCSNPEVGKALVGLYSQLTSEDVRYVGKLEVAEAAPRPVDLPAVEGGVAFLDRDEETATGRGHLLTRDQFALDPRAVVEAFDHPSS